MNKNQDIKSGTKQQTSSRFSPSINGFSIKGVQTMMSEDGYGCYCKVYFNNKKIGEYLDKGDGSEYSFYPEPSFNRFKIEEVVKKFPTKERDYGLGLMGIPYNIDQLVSDLLEMKEISKQLKRLNPDGRDYVLIDEWKTNRHLSCSVPSYMSDEELEFKLRSDLTNKGVLDYEVRRYRSLDDLHINNTFVKEDMFY